MRLRQLVVVPFLFLLSITSCFSTIIHVSTTGDDANDGLTWAKAKKTLFFTMDAASPGDEIWLAKGTYSYSYPVIYIPKPGLKIRGGFIGTENELGERPALPRPDQDPNETIIDERYTQHGIPVQDNGVIDGVTVRNCYYEGIGCGNGTITNCKIIGNGYGISCGGNAVISNCVIEGSKYDGVTCRYPSAYYIDTITITNTTVTSSGQHGVYLYFGSMSIRNCTVSQNTFGGIYCDFSKMDVSNSTISRNGNSNSYYRGGLYCENSTVTLTQNSFISNTGSGSALQYCHGNISGNAFSENTEAGLSYGIKNATNVEISNNVFSRNSYCGLIVGTDAASSTKIMNNIVVANTTDCQGGGISVDGVTPDSILIANNTIVGNAAPIGGGIYCDLDTSIIVNNIVAFNSSGIYYGDSTAFSNLKNNCVYNPDGANYAGTQQFTGSASNIQADPKLVSAEYGRLHIQPDSPCIDTGDNSVVETNWLDMDGKARNLDGNNDQVATVDIGADESDGKVWDSTPAIIRVSPTGDDSNSGNSWTSAKKTIQAAINAATIDGGEVWVAAGTYEENLVLKPFVSLYGGFAGTESVRSSRIPKNSPTLIDGKATGSVITITSIGNIRENIDGFTIKNGKAELGGGIYSTWANLTITRCIITGNSATYDGGGIYCSSAYPIVVGNIISNNTVSTGTGGGISCSQAVLTNNTIVANTASGAGGGVNCSYSTVSNNIISHNSSSISSYSSTLQNNYTSTAPGFVDEANGDYHLTANSPCVNAGTNKAPYLPETDMDSETRIMAGMADIGADEYTMDPISIKTIGGVKTAETGAWADIEAIVTYNRNGPAYVYIESTDRSSAILMRMPTGLAAPAVGKKLHLVGKVSTGGPLRYFYASGVDDLGDDTVKPLGITASRIGGKAYGYQFGLPNGVGLSNMGLLITTWGKITKTETGAFYINDGSTPDYGIKVLGNLPTAISADPIGKTVSVTGVVDMMYYNNSYATVRTRSDADIKAIN